MKIYVSHSSNYDYEHKLYRPLKESLGGEHELFLPHEAQREGEQSKNIIATSDFVLAEVSYPSTGQGIELGWADASGVPIICFHLTSATPSSSLRFISNTVYEYSNTNEMVEKMRASVNTVGKKE